MKQVKKDNSLPELWDRLQFNDSLKSQSSKGGDKGSKTNYRIFTVIGTLLGTIFWSYLIIQVFIYDLDRYIFDTYLPSYSYIIDYKFFVFLLLVTVCAVLVKRYFLMYLYILFFPLILLLWKFPKTVYKFKSWLLVLGVLEFITSLFYKLKFRIVVTTITLFSSLFVVISDSKLILIASIIALCGIAILTIFRTIYLSYKSSIFFSYQSKLISKFRQSSFAKDLILLDEEVRKSKSLKLTPKQSEAVLNSIQNAVLLNRGIYLWAYQLEKYRKSKVSFILSGFTYIWLYVKLILFLGFINFGLYKYSQANFSVSGSDSLLSFIYYSMNSLFLSEISAIQASSEIAIFVGLLSGLIGLLIGGVLLLNFFYVAKQNKTNDDLTNAIQAVKEEARELDKNIQTEFNLTANEAMKKLEEVQTVFIKFIVMISSQLPDDYK